MEKKKIKLAYFSDTFDRRPERTLFYRSLIEQMLKQSEFELYLLHYQAMPGESVYQRAHEILIPRVPSPWGSRFLSFVRYCLFTKDEFDVVHWFTPRLYPFFWLFPAKKFVVMAHGGGEVTVKDSYWTIPRRIFIFVIRHFNKYLDAVIGVSEYANKEIIYAFRIPPEKVVTIYNPVEDLYKPASPEQIEEVCRRYNISKPYFVYLGRPRLHKNVGNLVKGFLRYREKNAVSQEQLVLAGSSKEGHENIYGSLPDSRFVKDVIFTSNFVPSEDVPALYSGARALTYISLNEGFGLPVIEAMACRTPVITSSVTSLPEVAGDAAIIVDPHDIEDIASAMERVVTDESFRKKLIEKGVERSAFFTWEKTLSRLIGLYKGLLKN